jgi:methyl-accepting chemotaxis protein
MILLLVFISIFVGAASFYGLSTMVKQYQAHLVPALEAANSINTFTAKARRYEKEFFLFSSIGDNPAYKKKQQGYYNKLKATYEKIPPLLKAIDIGESDQFSNQEERLQLINAVRTSYNGTLNTLQPLTKQMLGGKTFTESAALYSVYKKSVHSLEDSIEGLRSHFSQALETQRQESIAFETEMITGLLAMSCGMIIFGILAGLFVSKRITNPLDKLMEGIEAVGQGEIVEVSVPSNDEFAEIAQVFNETINRIRRYIKTDEERMATEENVINFLEVVSEASDGDLTMRAPVTEDAFGSIADAYNLMIESLAALLTDTTINAEEVGEESRHLLEIFQKMKEGADSQLRHVTTATDAAEDTAESASQIAEKTAFAQRAAASVEEATNLGNERVNRNIEGMQLIRVTVQVINKKMKSLSERLLEIGTISQLISDVATRTTILAMNASIEASRAGEQGRGFLVISDEIKRLADEASEATRQIGGIIKAIQAEANDVTLALEEETSTVEEQTKIAQDTGEALAAINQSTNESKQVVTEITNLSQEQQQISDRMVAAIREMADITADTSALISESSGISEGLNGVSESLLQSLGQFRLSPAEQPVIEMAVEPQDIVNKTFLAPEQGIEPDQDLSAV